MYIVPMRDLKNTVEIEKKCKEANGPVFITKNGYGSLVVMDIEYYQRTIEKMYEALLINDGIADYEAGKIVEGKKAVAELRSKYGI